jgi:hypothetical protein
VAPERVRLGLVSRGGDLVDAGPVTG